MNSLIPSFSRFLTDPTDILFRDFFDSDGIFDTLFERKVNYPVDVKETDKGLEFDVAVVGLDKKDIKIEVKDGDILSISYDKKENLKGNETEKYVYKGITNRSFNLAWKISSKFDLNKLEAKLDRGLLKLTIPALPEKEAKFIEIKD